jgi:hypothetical protein
MSELAVRPLYERVCECGDFESDHQGGGPCGVCCQSAAPYDGCELFRAAGFEKLTDTQKGLIPMQSANKKKLGCDFDAELMDEFNAACKAKGVRKLDVVRDFIEKFCGRKPAKTPKKTRESKAGK